MGNYKNKAYPLRIDYDVMSKIKVIATIDDRSTNKLIERILKAYIIEYESEHGIIELPPEEC